jgi:glycosyltransferase involved in cell wall biosynthesis
VALLQFITFWNGNRLGENMLPAFVEHIASPLVVVLHEWPIPQEPEPDDHSWTQRIVRSTALRFVSGPRDYRAWLREQFFPRVAHFIVHSSELHERLREEAVDDHRITQLVPPVYNLRSEPAEGDPLAPAFLRAFESKRILLLFGFPHPRKNYELAIAALTRLPEDVVLVMAGSTEGSFRRDYVSSLFVCARSLGVEHRFYTTGEIGTRSLADLFDRSALAIAPFSYATGSASLGYFLGARLPVVASDIQSNLEVCRAGGGIQLFRQNDPNALADAIATVLNDPGRRHALRDRNSRFADQHNFQILGEVIGQRLRDAAARNRLHV